MEANPTRRRARLESGADLERGSWFESTRLRPPLPGVSPAQLPWAATPAPCNPHHLCPCTNLVNRPDCLFGEEGSIPFTGAASHSHSPSSANGIGHRSLKAVMVGSIPPEGAPGMPRAILLRARIPFLPSW